MRRRQQAAAVFRVEQVHFLRHQGEPAWHAVREAVFATGQHPQAATVTGVAHQQCLRTQLLDQVWGDHVYIEERTVDVHIRRLRLALEPYGLDSLIETVRGSGYRLAVPR